jgi:protease I
MKTLLIIAKKDFRDEELFDTQDALESQGIETVIASSEVGSCEGVLGGTAEATLALRDVKPEDYDAVLFIGGGGSSVFFNDPKAHEIAKKAKVLGAICIAPSTLANAGLLKGKRVTSYPSEKINLESKGAIFESDDVVIDGKLVTANGPKAARLFGEAVASLLGI